MNFRFGLKRLLFAIGLAAILLAVVTQVGIVEAEFEVWENNLHLNDQGLVQGELRLGFQSDEYRDKAAWPFDFKIKNVADRSLLSLQNGTKSSIKYRLKKFGPLKVQEPCRVYLTRVLGLDAESIVGYVMIKGRTEVVIDGSQ